MEGDREVGLQLALVGSKCPGSQPGLLRCCLPWSLLTLLGKVDAKQIYPVIPSAGQGLEGPTQLPREASKGQTLPPPPGPGQVGKPMPQVVRGPTITQAGATFALELRPPVPRTAAL